MARKRRSKRQEQPAYSESSDGEIQAQPGPSLDLDPHLQDVIQQAREGREPDWALVHEADDGALTADVIAKLVDPDRPVEGLEVVRKIGQIVTGSVRVDRIEQVRSDPNVISMKRATELHPDLQFSVPEIRASQAQLRAALPAGHAAVDGSGVVVGVVDYGCDFVHRNFRKADGSTRLLFLWDQRGGATSLSPAGFGYGREFATSAVNQALQRESGGTGTEDPEAAYQAIAYRPEAASHGTHVLDIAAGNGRATGAPGVAPNADLIFVEVSSSDLRAEDSFGNSRRLLDAVDYIFTRARQLGRPAVVNLSLGTHGGPHDGSTLVEQGFDELLQQQPGRAIVVSAGNSFLRASHASGRVARGEARSLSWVIDSGDQTDNELEVWYGGRARLNVTLVAPSGQRFGPVAPGETLNLSRQNVRVGRIIHRRDDPNNHDNQVDVLLTAGLPTGAWKVELNNPDAEPVAFHAWIERDDTGQSRFAAADSETSHTIGSISCGRNTIVVGSYSALVPSHDISGFSSAGPTRDGRQKPEVSAPGQSVQAARALTQRSVGMSGTSMASHHVTGVVALALQAAGRGLTIAEIREAVAGPARDDPPPASGWDPRFGQGRVDATGVVSRLIPAPVPNALPAPGDTPNGWPSPTSSGRLLPVHGDAAGGTDPTDHLIGVAAAVAHRLRSRVRISIEVEPVSD